jgi:hypothetical protein
MKTPRRRIRVFVFLLLSVPALARQTRRTDYETQPQSTET